MKKKLYVLFGLLVSLLLVGVVNAKGPYYLDWETEQDDNKAAVGNIAYKDGYITVDYTETGVLFTKFNNKGEEVLAKTYNEVSVYDVKVVGDYIYQVVNDDGDLYLTKVDGEFNVLKSAELEYEYCGYYFTRIGLEAIYVGSDKVVIPLSEGLAVYSLDLEFDQILNPTNRNIEKYYPGYQVGNELAREYDYNNYYLDAMGHKEGFFALGVYEENNACSDANASQGSPRDSVRGDIVCGRNLIKLFDDDGEEIWTVDIENDHAYIYEIDFLNNHIAAIVDYGNKTSINIYDMDGNLLQTIKSSDNYGFLRKTDNGFIVVQGYCGIQLGTIWDGPVDTVLDQSKYPGQKDGFTNQSIGDALNSCCATNSKLAGGCESNHQVYYLNRGIKAEVTSGKGTVEVASEQRPGEPVTFTVTPEEGYVIGVIKVTDANGNVLTFTDNTFTMPSADVTIEVEFLVENAKTADIAIMTAVVLAGFAFIMILISKKAIKE